MAALMRLGMPPLESGQRITRMRTMRSDGSLLYDLDVGRLQRRVGHPTIVIPRAELIAHLARQLSDGTIRFSRAAVGVATAGGSATLQTDDGTDLTGDVVLGADGHRSVIRSFVHDTGPARPTGLVAWQGVQRTAVSLAGGGDAFYIRGPHGWFGLMPAGDGRLQWWFDLPASETATVTADARAAWLQQRFRDWAAPVPEVIDELDQASIEPWPYVWHPVPPQLSRGRVVALGDAAHAMPPSLAQGANQTSTTPGRLRTR
jgi:FAD-dependent urate hydroxylase